MPTYICKEEALNVFLEYFITIKNEDQRSLLQDVYEKIKALPQCKDPKLKPLSTESNPMYIVTTPTRQSVTPLPADIPTFPITHYVKISKETPYYNDY